MTVTEETSDSFAVAQTIHLILAALKGPSQVKRAPPGPGTEFLVLSYGADFEYLWGLNQGGADGVVGWISSGVGEAARNLILVWDGMPSSRKYSTINVEHYVTPYDWAVAASHLSLRAARGGHGDPNESPGWAAVPHLRILIVDLKSQAYSGAFATEAFLAVGHALPWIQVYRPVQVDNTNVVAVLTGDEGSIPFLRAALPPGSLGTDTLLYDLTGLEGRILSLRQAQDEQNRGQVLEALIKLWRSNLVRPGDRHNVGNLLAPMLLAKGLPKGLREFAEQKISELNAPRRALKSLAEVVGLGAGRPSPNAGLPQHGILRASQAKGDVFGRRGHVRVLLIDDQYKLGYHHILGYTLFGEKYSPDEGKEKRGVWRARTALGRIHCVASPRCLLGALERADPVGQDWELPRVLPLSCDVLVLDLRLWVDKEGRKGFLQGLLGVCDQLGVQGIDDPTFHSALARAKRVVGWSPRGSEPAEEGDEASEVETLALLPLLLSHYDASLPVVLFSSTHQRALLASVSHRRNIITDFTKPILSGYGDEATPAALGRNLNRAFTRALDLHESRALWRRALDADWKRPTVCSVSWPTDGGKATVYNSPAVSWPPEQQRLNGGPMAPKLTGRILRQTLASHYRYYIEEERYYDYASVPWETLEGSLVPDRFLDNPNNSNPQFSLATDLDPRNHTADLLRHIRNKKTHGQARPPSDAEGQREHRFAALTAFMFFLDFLNGESSCPNVGVGRSLKELSVYLRLRYPHLRSGSNKPPRPQTLTADCRVSWLDFVAYTACYTAYAAISSDGAARFLSGQTAAYVQELAALLWRNCWSENRKRIPAGIGKAGGVPARVVARDAGHVYVEASDRLFFARLPPGKFCASVLIEDSVAVVIDDATSDIPLASEDTGANRLQIDTGRQRESPGDIAAWFSPPPQRVEEAKRSKKMGQHFVSAVFPSHEDAHRALRQLTADKRRRARLAR